MISLNAITDFSWMSYGIMLKIFSKWLSFMVPDVMFGMLYSTTALGLSLTVCGSLMLDATQIAEVRVMTVARTMKTVIKNFFMIDVINLFTPYHVIVN